MYRGVACHGVAMVVGRAVRRYWTLLLLLESSHRTVPSRSHAHQHCQLLSAVIRCRQMQDVEHLLSTHCATLLLATSHPPLIFLQKLPAILCIDWLWTVLRDQRRDIFWGAAVVWWMTVCLSYSTSICSYLRNICMTFICFFLVPEQWQFIHNVGGLISYQLIGIGRSCNGDCGVRQWWVVQSPNIVEWSCELCWRR